MQGHACVHLAQSSLVAGSKPGSGSSYSGAMGRAQLPARARRRWCVQQADSMQPFDMQPPRRVHLLVGFQELGRLCLRDPAWQQRHLCSGQDCAGAGCAGPQACRGRSAGSPRRQLTQAAGAVGFKDLADLPTCSSEVAKPAAAGRPACACVPCSAPRCAAGRAHTKAHARCTAGQAPGAQVGLAQRSLIVQHVLDDLGALHHLVQRVRHAPPALTATGRQRAALRGVTCLTWV